MGGTDMSSDNFDFIAKSGNVYLNLSYSAWEDVIALDPAGLTEGILLANSKAKPNMKREEYERLEGEQPNEFMHLGGRYYTEYGSYYEGEPA
jgi:hypothetical protein